MNTNHIQIHSGSDYSLNRLVMSSFTLAVVGMLGVLTFAQFILWA